MWDKQGDNVMNIKEVSIGDWVLAGGRPIYVTLAVLTVWSDNIKPLPITVEIIKKNGFKREMDFITDELDDFYSCINGRIEMTNDKAWINSNNKWNVYVYDKDNYPIANCELTYVHQLQQLLKLCKIDKEIVV